MNSAPRSTTAPSPNGTDQTRPPTRSRASSTVTSAPRARSASAAASPAKPAPTTTTRVPPPIGARLGSGGPVGNRWRGGARRESTGDPQRADQEGDREGRADRPGADHVAV